MKTISAVLVMALFALGALAEAQPPFAGASPTPPPISPATARPACGGESRSTFIPPPIFLSDLCGSCSDPHCVGKQIGDPCTSHGLFCTFTLPTCNSFTTYCTCQSV